MKLVQIPMKDGTTLHVTPDYYKKDGVRWPVGLTEAFEIADREGLRLPTVEEVNAIWEHADIQLTPRFMKPTDEMTQPSYFQKHDDMINDQLRNFHVDSETLIAGHKKDLVNISRNSDRVAIYGWHRRNGEPVQPYSTVHHRDYADYSHGLRLVKRTSESSDTPQHQETQRQQRRSHQGMSESQVRQRQLSLKERLERLVERLLRWRR